RALRDRPGLLRRIVPEAAPPGQDPRGLSEGTGARPGPGAAPGRGRGPRPLAAGLGPAPGRGRLHPPGLRWHAPELPTHPAAGAAPARQPPAPRPADDFRQCLRALVLGRVVVLAAGR